MPAGPRETSIVEYEVRVAARPETVFAYFTDPIKMVQWIGAEATLDPRPGGVCRIAFQAPQSRAEFVAASFGAQREQAAEPLALGGSGVMIGEFVEVDPYQRIVLIWGWEQKLLATSARSTLVEVSFTPDGEDTILQLAQRRLPAASASTSIELVGSTTSHGSHTRQLGLPPHRATRPLLKGR